MAGRRGRYPPEYGERLVELAKSGRSPPSPAREFEPSERTIRDWVRRADLNGRFHSDGTTTEARSDLRRPADDLYALLACPGVGGGFQPVAARRSCTQRLKRKALPGRAKSIPQLSGPTGVDPGHDHPEVVPLHRLDKRFPERHRRINGHRVLDPRPARDRGEIRDARRCATRTLPSRADSRCRR